MYRNMNKQMDGNFGWGQPMGGFGYPGTNMPQMTPGYGYPGMGMGPGHGYGPVYGQNLSPGMTDMPTVPGMTPGMGTPGYGMTPPTMGFPGSMGASGYGMNNPEYGINPGYGMSPGYEMPNYPGSTGTQPGLPYGGNNPMLPGMNPTTGVGKSGYFGAYDDLDEQEEDFVPGTPNFGSNPGFPYGY